MTVGVSLTRTLVPGSPADLAIPADYTPGAAYWLDIDGFLEPEFDERPTYATDSADVPGSILTQSVRGLGVLGLTVCTIAATGADLKAQKRALEAAVRQFTFTATVTIVGDPDDYVCNPAKVSWGPVEAGWLRQFMARAVVTIPVLPLGG